MVSWINDKIDRWIQPEVVLREHMQSLEPDDYVPKVSDIIIPSIAVASGFIVIRHILDRIVVPFGSYFNIQDSAEKLKLKPVPVLEAEYKKYKNPTSDTITILSKKSGLTEHQVAVWFRKRKRKDKPSDLKRLQDASWHFIFYIVMSCYGIIVLWDKPWFKTTLNCWIGWPGQAVTNDVYWYYIIELGFYLSAVYMLTTDHKRKDFTELIVHHMVTIFLIVMSFSYNLLRIGTLVLCVHDQVDYILSMAKIAIYCKKHKLADFLFVLFVLVWIATRLVIFPYVILHSVFIALPEFANDSRPLIQKYDRCVLMKFVKGSLLILQILHIIWTVMIVKSAAAKFKKGEIEDARSDSENSEIEDFDENVNLSKNGHIFTNGEIDKHT